MLRESSNSSPEWTRKPVLTDSDQRWGPFLKTFGLLFFGAECAVGGGDGDGNWCR